MPNTRDWQVGNLVQILVYGRSKIGKTFGAYSFPRPVVMDFDRGVATASNPDFVKQYGMRDIEYEQFTEKQVSALGVPLGHNAFDDACRFFDKMMKPDKIGTFDTWIIDSGTTLSEAALVKTIVLLGGKTGFKGVKSETHSDALAFGLVVPRIQDYGAERSLVEQFVTMILSSGKHVVFICHEKEKTDSSGNVIAVEPLLTGKGSEAVALMFDEVYRLKMFGTKRTLQTQSDAIVKAGSRYGVPNGIEWGWDSLSQEFTKLREAKQAEQAVRWASMEAAKVAQSTPTSA